MSDVFSAGQCSGYLSLQSGWQSPYLTVPRAPEPTEPISSFDASYFSSFLNVGSMITFGHSSIFPHPARDLYVRGVHHKCLRYSILTVGAVFADHLLGRPLDRYRVLNN